MHILLVVNMNCSMEIKLFYAFIFQDDYTQKESVLPTPTPPKEMCFPFLIIDYHLFIVI